MKSFEDILDESLGLLQRQGKISYRALKRHFDINDDYLKDLIFELTEVKQVAREEKGIMLVLIKGESISESEPVPELEQEQNAEKRQLTVMFVDLVGSTRLSNQLDAEDFANVLYEYQGLFDTIAKKYAGTIVQLLGDGIMTYFGHPIAHEDDPIRAVFSGIEMLNSLKNINVRIQQEYKTTLQVRIGIHTGFVVIGGTLVEGHTKQLALGEAPNLASRIQNFAQPDSMLISPITNRLIAGIFKTESTGHHKLKGIDEPMELFSVLGEKVDFNQSSGSENATGFVGRKNEKAIINEKWDKARSGKGQAILINGTAGIGKSRLIQNAVDEIANEPGSNLRLFCSPYNQNTPYYPIIRELKKQLSPLDSEPSEETKSKLQSFLKKHSLDEQNDLSLLVRLIGANDTSVTPIKASSDIIRQLTQSFLLRWLLSGAERYILLVEDVHWSDPSTLDFLDQVVKSIDHYPVLCIMTCRPEFVNTWKSQPHLHEILLSPLRREEAHSMIHQLAAKIPERILEELLEKTDGNPLFVEELTKLVLETGLQEKKDGQEPSFKNFSKIKIPSTLQDSLMARLDRMGEQAKRLAQMGAAIGREFSYYIIQSISDLPEASLNQSLETLINAEMIFESDASGNRTFTFKHALTQDAAYDTLLKKDRQEIHQKIVAVLKAIPKNKGANPELLAHHTTKAGLFKEAIPYWKQAGETAVARSAHKEAINHLREGLQTLENLPDSAEKISDELFFQLSIGVPYTVLLGYGSPEVEKAYSRAKELSESLEESNQLITALYGLWRHYLLRAKYKESKELSDRLLHLTNDSDDIITVNIANRAAGSTAFYTGRLEEAKHYLERIVSSEVSHEKHNESLLYDVIDMWVAAHSYLSWTYWLLGETNRAKSSISSAIKLAKKLNHPFSIAFSLCFSSWLHQFLGDYEKTVLAGQKGLEISEEHGFKFWLGWAHLMIHWVGDQQGKQGQLEKIEKDLKDWFSTGSRLGTSYFLYLRAERYLHNNLFDQTQEYLVESGSFMSQTGESFWEPEILRLRGDYHLILEEDVKALELYKQALLKAEGMSSKSLQLRALNSILTCVKDIDSIKLYHEKLTSLLPFFSEQAENLDLIKSKEIIKVSKSSNL